MSSYQISKLLEKYLKIIGKKNRIDILKKLYFEDKDISFSDIQREFISSENNSINLSFHLNALKEVDLIESSQKGYRISKLGKTILNKIFDIEHTLNQFNESVLIRTSKYITEPFNIQKVKDYLIKEAEMETFLANRIAKLVECKIKKTNIKYLTTPLMREYINGILLEEGLEEFRHKLTRLGVPPYDTFELFNNESYNPNQFIEKLGSEVSEQFLLLNLLPKELADLYLSKKLILLNLNYWALKPLNIFLQSKSIFNYIRKTNLDISPNNDLSYTYFVKFLIKFQEFFNTINPYFSNDAILLNLDEILNKFILSDNKFNKIVDLLVSQIHIFNLYSITSKIKIGLNLGNNIVFKIIQKIIANKFFTINNSKDSLFLNYSHLNIKNSIIKLLENPTTSKFIDKYIFYNGNNTLFNSNLTKHKTINSKKSNKIILDQILVNLTNIALEAKQDDNKFFEILENRIYSTFDLFKQKKILIEKKIGNSKVWKKIIENLFEHEYNNWIDYTIKSISFVGLNEAVKNHCGLEFDRISQSESFAIKILKTMNNIILERNELDNNMFSLSQAINTISSHDYRIIRNNSNLSLERKILLFKKFNKFLNGGSLFEISFNPEEKEKLIDHIDLILDSDLSAFKFSYY
ncbi:MAG: hypothetical protein KGD57_08090 [Candidatus Lokiarchaeota archaeon]|nr:hypothetical protein [Candidatus Lokiarchaeota archaeon]